MTKLLTPEQMLELEHRHAAAERRLNFEETMATIAPEPHYEFHPLGFIVTSREAVEQLYRRVLPPLYAMGYFAAVDKPYQANAWERKRRSLSFGENTMATEDEFMLKLPSGVLQPSVICVVMQFEDGLVKGERVFYDRHYGPLILSLLGPDYQSLPGVKVW